LNLRRICFKINTNSEMTHLGFGAGRRAGRPLAAGSWERKREMKEKSKEE
jgi:hypothetical protein